MINMTKGLLDLNEFLFVTEVGSAMWKMDTPESDHDLICIYQTPSSQYLRTGNFDPTRPAGKFVENDKEYDAQYMEIGHLVNLLMKGNVNAIWAVMSPIVYKTCNYHKDLINIVRNNLSKSTYASVRGMAISQYTDATKRMVVRSPLKSLKTCVRTLWFGESLLNGYGCVFQSVPQSDKITTEFCDDEFNILDNMHRISILPEQPNPAPFYDFILDLRLDEIYSSYRHIMGVVEGSY